MKIVVFGATSLGAPALTTGRRLLDDAMQQSRAL
jgi:hypothetical protein